MSKTNSATVIAIDADANPLRAVVRVFVPVIGTLAYEFVRESTGVRLASVKSTHGRDPHRDGASAARAVAVAAMGALQVRLDERYPLAAALRKARA